MLPAFKDLDLLGGVRHVRAQWFGSTVVFREGLLDSHQALARRGSSV